MSLKLEWSPDALEDMDSIWDYIAKDNIDRAESFIDELREYAAKLCTTPRMGTIIPEFGKEEYRELHFEGYNIMYEITDYSILIHEVYNQRRIYIRMYNRGDIE